jgi:PH/SEC7 domain-containing protein
VCSNPDEVQQWIDAINFVAASFSSAPLPPPVGSHHTATSVLYKPLLPSAPTRLPLHAQIGEHERRVTELNEQLALLHADAPPRTAKGAKAIDFFHKERYLIEEVRPRPTILSNLSLFVPA